MSVTQEALAIDLNTTQQAISALEKKKQIDYDTLLKIVELLKIPVNLLDDTPEDNPMNFITITNNSFYNTSSLNINSNIINNNLLDTVRELYERIITLEKELRTEKERK